MQIDRWVIPPALAAAVSAVCAVAPPVGGDARGWRVEAITLRAGPTRVTALVRATVEDRTAERLEAPATAALEIAGARVPLVAAPGGAWAYGAWTGARLPPVVVVVGAGLRARFTLPPPRASSAETPAGGALLVGALEGTLVPGVEGTAVFSSSTEVAEWRVEPALDTTRVGAEQKGRSLALIRVRVDGMGAPVTVVRRAFDGEERRDVARLPVSSLGVAVEAPLPSLAAPERVTLRGAFAGAQAVALWGDDRGACGWRGVRLGDAPEGGAADLPLPIEGPCIPTWIEATTDATLAVRAGRRLAQATDPLRAPGHPDVFAAWPTPPRPVLAHDGARRAESSRAARARSARRASLGALALSVALEIAIVFGVATRPPPSGIEEIDRPLRSRLGALVAGVALLAVVGLAMAIAALLQP